MTQKQLDQFECRIAGCSQDRHTLFRSGHVFDSSNKRARETDVGRATHFSLPAAGSPPPACEVGQAAV
jgi:hypothetical protein